MLKLSAGILVIMLGALMDTDGARGQTVPADAKPAPHVLVRTFFLNNVMQGGSEGDDIRRAVRTTLDEHVVVSLDPTQNAIVVSSINPDDIALAEKIITELDRPKKTYRLTYTVTELDGTKRMGTQHFAMVMISGQRTTLMEGSKVPIATGSFAAGGSAGVQTQFTYLDIGMNFDATVDELGKGVRLRSKVSQSGIAVLDAATAEGKAAMGMQPVIRNASLEGASYLVAGKPLVLGSMDIPGSTRHLDIEVVMEQLP